eukprot:Skav224183  [mRNA]  locus=scaffold1975:168555:171289:+ [translate_table: standard]
MALRSEEGWDALHRARFGDRWDELRMALERDHEHLCYVNPFLSAGEQDARESPLVTGTAGVSWQIEAIV